jgi:hypothetical protein
MELTASEYCQFGLLSQIQILHEFGKKISDKKIGDCKVMVFKLYNFYVALLSNLFDITIKIELITTNAMYNFYTSFG